ncbi:MAG TPA: hypothetical protein VJ063_20855 [Verrucomicrobiae bacterium]|nr:hypothetical protein [Verrucomicrobiae bacterium]
MTFRSGTGANAAITRLALQRDTRILAGGFFSQFNDTSRNGCVRLLPDGSVDPSFTPAGFSAGDVQFLSELPDGKIVANISLNNLVRWNSDGSIDPYFPDFSANVRTDVIGVQPDGQIVAVGSGPGGYGFGRLQTNGASDFTFNSLHFSSPDGARQPPYYVLWGAALKNGKLLSMGGGGFFRLHRHGARDLGFRADSIAGVHLALEKADGEIFVAGVFTNILGVPRFTLALLEPDGTPDLAFNPEVPPAGTIQAMAVQPDGKLLIGGSFTNVGSVLVNRLARLNPDGTLDPDFNVGTGPSGTVNAIVLQRDYKVIVAGGFTIFDGYPRGQIVRLNTDAERPPVITREPVSQSVLAGANAWLAIEATCVPPAAFQWFDRDGAMANATNAVLLLSNILSPGEYYAVVTNPLGVATSAVATLSLYPAPSAPGSVVPEYPVGEGADSTIRVMARQSSGKLIVAGWFTQIHGVPCPAIARLNSDGSVDRSFNVGTGPTHRIMALAVDPADRILVAGMFTNFNGQALSGLTRLNPNGDIDTTFEIGSGFTGGRPTAVNALALQQDGKILAGGNFSYFNHTSRDNIARLLPNGAVDTSFVPRLSIIDVVLSLALPADGRIWVGHQNGLDRLEVNGVVTTPPSLEINNQVRCLLVQPDQKVLVGGLFYFGNTPGVVPSYALTRLTIDGTLDTNFNHSLYASSFYVRVPSVGVETLRLHTCGRILVGGYFMTNLTNRIHYQIARLEQDGSVDPVFGAKALDGTAYAIDVEPSAEVVIGGQFSAVDHTLRNGLALLHEPLGPPTVFAQPTSQTADGGREVLLSVVVTNCIDFTFQWQLNGANIPGATNSSMLLPSVRLQDAGDYRVVIRNGAYTSISEPAQLQVNRERRHPGSIDVDFLAPRTLDGPVQALAFDGGGNLFAGGAFTRLNGGLVNALARFNWRGELDPDFRVSSNLIGTVYSVALQPDGKILAAGVFPPSTRFLYRLLPNGRFDTNFQSLANPQGTALSVASLSDGKILVGGVLTAASLTASRTGIARLHTNGTLDTSFSAGGVRYPLCFARQKDGRIIIGGTFTNVGTTVRNGLGRLHPDGQIDTSFDPGEGVNSPVMAIVLARDEQAYIGGNFTRVGGMPRAGIARLNDDGSVDTSFDPGLGVHSAWALAVQPDGKLIVGGSFTRAGGLPRAGLARFNTEGTIDATFDPGSGANGQVLAVLCDPAGKIYLGGNFTAYNGFSRDHLARANGNLFLLNPQFVAGRFRVSLFTFYGQSYALEFKDVLPDADWAQGSSLLGDGTIRIISDSAPDAAGRWYRVRTEP